ncbi:UFP0650 endoplasmic reticulum membrane protein, putative, partial [Rhizoctonia solani AG-3 Rhs1AP]
MTLPKNYRPIALLETLSKLLEKVITRRLIFEAGNNNIIPQSQFGGRDITSCTDAGLCMIHDIRQQWQRNCSVSLLTLDVSGYFNNVDHTRLIYTLNRLGYSDQICNWLQSYLSNRTAQFRIDGVLCPSIQLPAVGIPQGSPLSPILSSLYSIPLLLASLHPQAHSFAYIDDFTILAYSDSHINNINIMKNIIQDINETAIRLGLEFELPKSDLIHFIHARRPHSNPTLTFSYSGTDTVIQPRDSLSVGKIPKFGMNYIDFRFCSVGPADVTPIKMFITKSALEGPDPEVVLVAEKKLRGKRTKTSVVFHFEALTGRWVAGGPSGAQVSGTEVVEAFTLPGQSNVVGVVSTRTPALGSLSTRRLNSSLRVPVGSELRGYSVDSGLSTPAVETWKKAFTTPATFPNTISSHLQVIHRPISPVASYGKVLGDRTTLYKYLNPNAAAVLAPDCAVRVVDLVSGAIVFDSGSLPAPCEPPKVAFTENWLVYAHEVAGNATDKGTKVVSVELYEGERNDDKTNSIESSSFSERSARLHAIQQSFLFPYSVVALGTTATKFGISSKGLLLATSKNQIYHIHRRLLDPRRPLGKPTAQDQEEMLFQYDPVLPPDTRRIVTHKNQVLGTTHLVAAPTLLESTSCVLAYGLDLFHTRVTPSGTFDLLGSGFNKLQLLLTIVGLSVAIVVVRPLVARKQQHAQWYQ